MNLATEGEDQPAVVRERLDIVILLVCVQISQEHEPGQSEQCP